MPLHAALAHPDAIHNSAPKIHVHIFDHAVLVVQDLPERVAFLVHDTRVAPLLDDLLGNGRVHEIAHFRLDVDLELGVDPIPFQLHYGLHVVLVGQILQDEAVLGEYLLLDLPVAQLKICEIWLL